MKRPFKYAEVRVDKQADPGHSREIVCINSDPSVYDHFENWDYTIDGETTILGHLKKQVRNRPDRDWLGTRPPLGTKNEKGEPLFGPYEWITFKQVDDIAINVSRCLQKF
jgi:hypothetical protein